MSIVNRSFECSQKLTSIQMRLIILAEAFGTTGNFHMDDRLTGLAEEIEEQAKEIKAICSDTVQADFDESQRGVASVLKGLLKGSQAEN